MGKPQPAPGPGTLVMAICLRPTCEPPLTPHPQASGLPLLVAHFLGCGVALCFPQWQSDEITLGTSPAGNQLSGWNLGFLSSPPLGLFLESSFRVPRFLCSPASCFFLSLIWWWPQPWLLSWPVFLIRRVCWAQVFLDGW